MVIRNDKGEFVTTKSVPIQGCSSVEIGEAMRFMEALFWVKDLPEGYCGRRFQAGN